MSRARMFFRLILKAFQVQPGRVFISLCALLVGATLASAFLNLYFDLPRKMTAEFRSLGPNLVVAPPGNAQTFYQSVREELAATQPNLLKLPWLYAVGKMQQEDVILGGTELFALGAANPGWRVVNGPLRNAAAPSLENFLVSQFGPRSQPPREWLLAGEKAAAHFGWQPGQRVTLAYGGEEITLPLVGILSTGESADSQVLVPLATLQALTHREGQLSLMQLAAPGSAEQVEEVRQQLAASLTKVEIRPLRQVVESEARVVMKVRGLMFGLTAIVLGIVILSVMTTVSGLVFDRRRDIGVMKALGGSDRAISLLFVAQTALLAVLATIFGYLFGFGLAQWAALHIFHSALGWRWDVLPAVLAVTLAIALAATAFPIHLIRRLHPAVILKGE